MCFVCGFFWHKFRTLNSVHPGCLAGSILESLIRDSVLNQKKLHAMNLNESDLKPQIKDTEE